MTKEGIKEVSKKKKNFVVNIHATKGSRNERLVHSMKKDEFEFIKNVTPHYVSKI